MPRPAAIAVVVALTAAWLASVAASPEQRSGTAVQPVAAAGQFVWHDLVTDNPAAAVLFYGALFGWTFEPGEGVDPDYTIIKQDGLPIGGVVRLRRTQPAAVAQWLSYVVVPDVEQAVEAFRQAGGQVFRGPLSARRDLRVAAVADPQGAPLGLASRGPREAVAASAVPAMHRWLWMEYVATDTASALDFYRKAIGFGHEISEARTNFTYYLLTTDRPQAGLFRSPWQREASAWLPYVRVANPEAMAVRALELGGQVALPPTPGIRNGSLAIVLDPSGAPLALQRYPFETGVTP